MIAILEKTLRLFGLLGGMAKVVEAQKKTHVMSGIALMVDHAMLASKTVVGPGAGDAQ